MKEGISRMDQLQVDSILQHTKHKRQNLIGVIKLAGVTSKPRHAKGKSFILFVPKLHLVISNQNYSLIQ